MSKFSIASRVRVYVCNHENKFALKRLGRTRSARDEDRGNPRNAKLNERRNFRSLPKKKKRNKLSDDVPLKSRDVDGDEGTSGTDLDPSPHSFARSLVSRL